MITNVTFTLRGQTYTLTESNGVWQATITAPNESSWYEPDHAFVGTIHADSVDDLGLHYSTEEQASIRVLETIKPVISVRQPCEDWRFNMTGTPKFIWKVTDLTSGVVTVSMKIDGVAVTGIETTQSGTDCWCEWQGEVAEGQHTAVFDAVDNDGNVADTVTVIFGVFKLIWDRTNADVEHVKKLNSAINKGTASAAELAEWFSDPKGAYNASDMNRVGWAEYFLERLSQHYGFDITLAEKRDWAISDVPNKAQEDVYIDNLTIVRTLPHDPLTPQVPENLENLTYQTANDIEKILRDVQLTMTRSRLSWFASGEIACGE